MKKDNRPNLNHQGQKELEKMSDDFDQFNEQVKKVSSENTFSKSQEKEMEIEDKLLDGTQDLEPISRMKSKEPFNENFRKEYEYASEKVYFIAENTEIIGESIVMWTKPFAGLCAEQWSVPVNKPVRGPRYLFEQIKRKFYNRLTMEQKQTSNDGMGSYFGAIVATNKIHRLNANEFNPGSFGPSISFKRRVS